MSKTVIMRGGDYKCRAVKMCLKLRDQQLKTITQIDRQIDRQIPHGKHKPKIYNRYTHTKEKGIQT